MKLHKDKNGVIWAIILLIGAYLIAGSYKMGLWTSCLGGLLIGLAYGSQWVRALGNERRNNDRQTKMDK